MRHLDTDVAFALSRVFCHLDGSIEMSEAAFTSELSYLHAVVCQSTRLDIPLEVSRVVERLAGRSA